MNDINILEKRRIKLLKAIYYTALFTLVITSIRDYFIEAYVDSAMEGSFLVVVLMAYIFLVKKEKYLQASYFIVLLISVLVIAFMFLNQFNDMNQLYILMISITAIFLLGLKRGFIFTALLYSVTLSIMTWGYFNFSDTLFLNNIMAMSNFIVVSLISLMAIYFFESTREQTYGMLLEANKKQEMLYREVHHRVKNNLNIVTSMLGHQARNKDDEVQSILQLSQQRIETIAMVHNMLYNTKDIGEVSAYDYFSTLIEHLKQSYYEEEIIIDIDCDDIYFGVNEIIPLGLIVNELIVNSFKHAFHTTSAKKITLQLVQENTTYTFKYSDNGHCHTEMIENAKKSLGMKLIELNIKQLKATSSIECENGFFLHITFQSASYV